MSEQINAELELLRDFFAKWENFHQIAKAGNRDSTEMAAKRMVVSATAYRNFQGFHASDFEPGHG